MTRTVASFGAVLLAAAGCLAGSCAARAEPPSYTIEDVTACSKDALRLCKDKLADLDAIEACMKAKYAELSPKCQARFDRDH